MTRQDFHFFGTISSTGVIAVSWYPADTKDDNGEPIDDVVPLLLDVAQRYAIKVSKWRQ